MARRKLRDPETGEVIYVDEAELQAGAAAPMVAPALTPVPSVEEQAGTDEQDPRGSLASFLLTNALLGTGEELYAKGRSMFGGPPAEQTLEDIRQGAAQWQAENPIAQYPVAIGQGMLEGLGTTIATGGVAALPNIAGRIGRGAQAVQTWMKANPIKAMAILGGTAAAGSEGSPEPDATMMENIEARLGKVPMGAAMGSALGVPLSAGAKFATEALSGVPLFSRLAGSPQMTEAEQRVAEQLQTNLYNPEAAQSRLQEAIDVGMPEMSMVEADPGAARQYAQSLKGRPGAGAAIEQALEARRGAQPARAAVTTQEAFGGEISQEELGARAQEALQGYLRSVEGKQAAKGREIYAGVLKEPTETVTIQPGTMAEPVPDIYGMRGFQEPPETITIQPGTMAEPRLDIYEPVIARPIADIPGRTFTQRKIDPVISKLMKTEDAKSIRAELIGKGQINKKYTVENAHQVLSGLKSRRAGMQKGTREADKDIQQIDSLIRRMGNRIETLSPGYKQATKEFREALPGVRSLSEAQYRFVQKVSERAKLQPEELGEMVMSTRTSPTSFMKMRNALADNIGEERADQAMRDLAQQFIQKQKGAIGVPESKTAAGIPGGRGEWQREKLKAAVGPEKFSRLIARTQIEQEMIETYNKVMNQASTAANLAQAEKAYKPAVMLGLAGETIAGGRQAALRLLSKGVRYLSSNTSESEIDREVGELLMSQGAVAKQNIAKMQKYWEAMSKTKRGADFLTKLFGGSVARGAGVASGKELR